MWLRVAALSFGGPAGQIAVMHRILVDEKRWIGEARFLHALNFCMLLPGPEAQQLAIYLGWLLHRTWGGVVAGVLFVLPGFLAILALSLVYVTYGDVGLVEGIFFGLKAAVLAIVLQAVVRIGSRALRSRPAIALAAVAFVAIFGFAVPFPIIVFGAGVIGYFASRAGSEAFRAGGHGGTGGPGLADADSLLGTALPAHARGHGTIRVAAIFLVLWLAPVALLLLLLGPDQVFTRLALFFSQMAIVTFGGAYAVLAYVAQAAAETYMWVTPGEMLDGLGMAETTPGPADHGGAVRRLPRRIPRPGQPRSLPGGGARVGPGHLGDLHPVLPLDLPRRALHRAAPPQPRPRRRARRDNRGGRRASSSTWRSGSGCTCSFASSSRCVHSASAIDVPVLSSVDLASLALFLAAMVATFRFRVGVLPLLAGAALLGCLWVVLVT